MRSSIHSVVFAISSFCALVAIADAGTVRFNVRDTNGQIPCRIHLTDPSGKPVESDQPFFRDHFVCNGQIDLELAPGEYNYIVARGPEYKSVEGRVRIDETASEPALVAIALERISQIRQQGWYSADLHVHRRVEHIEQLMMAEDLDFAPVITWWNERNLWRDQQIPSEPLTRFDRHRLYHVMGGEDEREGGALLYFDLEEPIDITQADREFPSPVRFIEQAEVANHNVWIDIEKPFWWDVPVWLATGKADSIGLANNHMCRAQMYPDEAWGRPRDTVRLPSPHGNGFWTQEIYYHALNAGIRIPPSAGSASGVLPNPVGYNRVYVHLDGGLEYQKWWDGLRAGRCFVTNGPMLLCQANGHLPGHAFQSQGPITVDFDIKLTGSERIKNLQVIHNGKVVKELPTDRSSIIDQLTFESSGWFLVRAIVDNDITFRFASTGPYYIELAKKPEFISRSSVEFFQDWISQRIGRVEQNVRNVHQRSEVLKYHFEARRFWENRHKLATDD